MIFQAPPGATQVNVLGSLYVVENGTISVTDPAQIQRLLSDGWLPYGSDAGITVPLPVSGELYSPSGLIDGSNQTFYCPFAIPSGKAVRVFLNGMRQGSADCNVMGRVIVFSVAPPQGSLLEVELP